MNNQKNVPYHLLGDLFDACSCHAPCPCWVGDEADDDACDSSRVYRFDKGSVLNGEDVSGLCVVTLERSPMPSRNSGWQKVILIDKKASKAKRELLEQFFTGKIPSDNVKTDMSDLIGSRVDIEDAEITFSTEGNKGHVRVVNYLVAEMEQFKGDDKAPITMVNARKGAPGATMYIGKNTLHSVRAPKYNFDWSFTKRSAMLTKFEYKS